MSKPLQKSFATRIRLGFAWSLAGSIGQALVAVIISAILARLLEPADFGLIASASIIIGFGELFIEMGISGAVVQTKNLTTEKISTAFTFSIGLGILFFLVFLILNPFITSFLEMPDLLPILNIFIFLFPLKSFTLISFGLLQRNFSFKNIAGLDVISFAIGYGIPCILLAYFGYGVWALVYAIVVKAIIHSILIYFFVPYRWNLRVNKAALISLLSFGKGFTLVRFLNYLALKGDQLIVGRLLGVESLGFYNKAYGLMNLPNGIVGRVINRVFFAGFAEIQNDKERLTRNIEKAFKVLFLLVIPIACWCWVLAPEIISVLLGDKWSQVILPFRILTISMVFRLGHKLAGAFAKGVGAMHAFAKSQFIYMVFVIVGSWIGTSLGLIGVAIAINIAIFVMFVLLLKIVNDYSFLTWFSYFKILVVPIIFSIASTFLLIIFIEIISIFYLEDIFILILSGLFLFIILSFTYLLNNKFNYLPLSLFHASKAN